MLIFGQDLYVCFRFYCLHCNIFDLGQRLCQILNLLFRFQFRPDVLFRKYKFLSIVHKSNKKGILDYFQITPVTIRNAIYRFAAAIALLKIVNIPTYKTHCVIPHTFLQTCYGYLLDSIPLFFTWNRQSLPLRILPKPLIRTFAAAPYGRVVYAAILSQFVLKRWLLREASFL